jgi:hypothetical protein
LAGRTVKSFCRFTIGPVSNAFAICRSSARSGSTCVTVCTNATRCASFAISPAGTASSFSGARFRPKEQRCHFPDRDFAGSDSVVIVSFAIFPATFTFIVRTFAIRFRFSLRD